MEQLHRDSLFVALTRPQMFGGVTYTYFVSNFIVAAELFLVFKSLWVLVPTLIVHGVGVVLCLREPRFFELWMTWARTCGRTPNYALWRCNSYRP